MNTYQVILSNCDVLMIRANFVRRDGGYLCFYDEDGDDARPIAQFASWQGWNRLVNGQVEPVKVHSVPSLESGGDQ